MVVVFRRGEIYNEREREGKEVVVYEMRFEQSTVMISISYKKKFSLTVRTMMMRRRGTMKNIHRM